jgi:hypothetical protein
MHRSASVHLAARISSPVTTAYPISCCAATYFRFEHASITVTAHTYADLFDDELDNIAVGARLSKRLLAEVSLAAADSGPAGQRPTAPDPRFGQSWATAAQPCSRMLRCGWRATQSSRRLDRRSFEKRPEEVLRRDVASDLPPCGQSATWPHIGRMKGPKAGPRVVSSDASEPTTCTDSCGPGWDRTSDLPRVKRTLFH